MQESLQSFRPKVYSARMDPIEDGPWLEAIQFGIDFQLAGARFDRRSLTSHLTYVVTNTNESDLPNPLRFVVSRTSPEEAVCDAGEGPERITIHEVGGLVTEQDGVSVIAEPNEAGLLVAEVPVR